MDLDTATRPSFQQSSAWDLENGDCLCITLPIMYGPCGRLDSFVSSFGPAKVSAHETGKFVHSRHLHTCFTWRLHPSHLPLPTDWSLDRFKSENRPSQPPLQSISLTPVSKQAAQLNNSESSTKTYVMLIFTIAIEPLSSLL
ncbi:unnamed protein product [Protopolystoma xenopodis]|uniref:Uncharacterized protein n=1 Tax=Protopolystoma xenopodis TaxID=117903 RepID=A0A448WCS8_9PLAT|nr:unnamed protein product [Protopolystoma xenopodis]